MTPGDADRLFSVPDWAWYVAGALIYLSCGFTEIQGSDLWWHLAGGREIAQQQSLWLTDDWSFTAAGEPWRNHEWLPDLIYYGWISLFGIPSLVIWKWLLLVSSFLLLQRVLLRLSDSPAAALLAASTAAVVAGPFLDVRPQLYTLFGVMLLLNLALQRPPRLGPLLALFLVWANLHGGFVFGLMLLGILLFPWTDFSWERLGRAIRTGLACAAITLLNPDGYVIYVQPLTYALMADSPYRTLAEWRSPFESGGIVSPGYVYTLIVGAALAALWVLPTVRRHVSVVPEVLAMTLLTAAMSSTSRRFIILWAVAFALLLMPFLGFIYRQRALEKLLPILLGVAVVWGLWRLQPYSLRPAVAYHFLTAEYVYPHGVADFVELNGLQGNVFAYYNWGGFLHWRTDGDLKVFIDGRANTLYDDQTYNDYVTVLGRRHGWQELVHDSAADFFLWPHDRKGRLIIDGLRSSGRWTVLYEGARGTLLARSDRRTPESLRVPEHGFYQSLATVRRENGAGNNAAALKAARSAYDAQPWHVDACRWLSFMLAKTDRVEESDVVRQDCRNRFASRFLP